MSAFEEIQPQDLISIYQQAHEELAQLEGRAPQPGDHSQAADETRAAISRHRTMVRQLHLALRERP